MQYMPFNVELDVWLNSDEFDYNSLMIYDSFSGSTWGSYHFPLVTFDEEVIYTGGNPDPIKAGPSPLDIQRVAMLYPKQHVDRRAIPGALSGKWSNDTTTPPAKQPTLEFVIPGVLTTTIVPVPTEFPKAVNDTKAMQIAEKYAATCRSGGCLRDVVVS